MFSKALTRSFILALTIFAASCTTAPKHAVNIACSYTFNNVKNESDQQKIENAIISVVGNEFTKTGTDINPKYKFVVQNAAQIDLIHDKIAEIKSGKEKSKVTSTLFGNSDQSSAFYMEDPKFNVVYGSLGLEAKVEVIVKFKITPGSKLWYKPENQLELDITDKVDKQGNVKFTTKIFKNQEFILGRTSYKGAERFIKINIFSGEVTEINKRDYE
jgi:hypothetical protein